MAEIETYSEYKFIETNKHDREKITNGEDDVTKECAIFLSLIQQIRSLIEESSENIEICCGQLEKAANLIAYPNIKQISGIFMDQKCYELVLQLLNEGGNIVDPFSIMLFISNSLMIPNTDISYY